MEALLLVLALLAAVPVLAWFGQDSLIFHPQPAPRSVPQALQSLELIAADGTLLRGWLRKGLSAAGPSTQAPLVVYFGGNAEEVSATVLDPGWPRSWTIAAINYRGYGGSGGRASEAALVADARSVLDALSRRPDVDPTRIVVVGRSLGSALAVRLAAERPLAGVILVSPYDSLVEIGRQHFPLLPVSMLLRHRFDVRALAARAQAPMLALIAERDTIIAPERSKALIDLWPVPHRQVVIDDADHNSLGSDPAYWDAIQDFLATR